MADLRLQVMEDAAFEPNSGPYGRDTSCLARPPARSLLMGARSLERAVEFEILPRLVLRQQSQIVGRALPPVKADPYSDEVKAFADLVMGKSQDRAGAHIQSLHEQNIPLEKIYLQLVAPAARYLQYLWSDDQRDFADVTLGLWRLQQLLREFSSTFRNDAPLSTGHRALLTPGPGETHQLGYLMFGLVLAGEFFRRDGWDTWIEPDSTNSDFASVVRSEWFDVVEFLVSSDKRLDALASSIRTVRRESLNQGLGVVVSGQIFSEHPELVVLTGGDMFATDAGQGVSQARHLVGLIESRK